MKNGKGFIALFVAVIFVVALIYLTNDNSKEDEWHNHDGSEIVCRVSSCGKRPLYSDWSNRFCTEHIDRSEDHSNNYSGTVAKKKINSEKALTKEEADALRGTGYNGTRPNSSAENSELAAAMIACKNCGMRSHNGANSLCYECQYNKDYGLD